MHSVFGTPGFLLAWNICLEFRPFYMVLSLTYCQSVDILDIRIWRLYVLIMSSCRCDLGWHPLLPACPICHPSVFWILLNISRCSFLSGCFKYFLSLSLSTAFKALNNYFFKYCMLSIFFFLSRNLIWSVFLPLSIYSHPEVKFGGHMLILFLIFWEAAILLPTGAVPFDIPPNSAWETQFFQILIDTCHFLLLRVAMLMGMSWYLIVVSFGFPND